MSKMLENSMDYYVIDTETTGLPTTDKYGNIDFNNVYIVEVGVCKTSTQADPLWAVIKSCLIKLPTGINMSSEATKVNGITDEMLVDGVGSCSDAISKLDLCSMPSVVVGHNILFFDLPLLFANGVLFKTMTVIDTALVWKAFCMGMKRHKWESFDCFWGRVYRTEYKGQFNLDFLTQVAVGSNGTQKHRVAGDCIRTALVFNFMWSRKIIQDTLYLGDVLA